MSKRPFYARMQGIMKELERTAYHEAGHAVALYLMDSPFEYATIESEGELLGHVSVTPIAEEELKNYGVDRARKLLECHYINSLAGMISVRKAIGDMEKSAERDIAKDVAYSGAEEDAEYAQQCLNHLNDRELNLDGKSIEDIRDELMIKAIEMIHDERNWKAVEALVKALLEEKTIGYRRARKIIHERIKHG